MFNLQVNNKKVQKKLCTEPKEPEKALEFAIVFHEVVKRQKAYESNSSEPPSQTLKANLYLQWRRQIPRSASDEGSKRYDGARKVLPSHQLLM